MGDTGSLILGLTLAYLSIAVTQKQGSIVPPAVPLLVLAIPITDTLTLMVKRAWNGKSPFHPDRFHLHHILMRYGLRMDWSVLTILAISCAFSILAISGTLLEVPDYLLFAFFALFFTSYFTASFQIKRIFRLRRHFRSWGKGPTERKAFDSPDFSLLPVRYNARGSHRSRTFEIDTSDDETLSFVPISTSIDEDDSYSNDDSVPWDPSPRESSHKFSSDN